MQSPSYLDLSEGHRIAYVQHAGSAPGVLFLPGFKSDMNGAKALALEAHCREKGIAFTRFDYTGHGASSGAFAEGTIGGWKQDALTVLDKLTKGKQIVVGSSMGGWLMLLLALARPDRVAGLVGIASAPDFTEALIWERFNRKQQRELKTTGSFAIPNCYGTEPYLITYRLIEEGRRHLLLVPPPSQGAKGEGNIPITCPVRLLHGMVDEDVPWQLSRILSHRLESQDVTVSLIKNGNHRLSEPQHLRLLCDTVHQLYDCIRTSER